MEISHRKFRNTAEFAVSLWIITIFANFFNIFLTVDFVLQQIGGKISFFATGYRALVAENAGVGATEMRHENRYISVLFH